VTAAEISDAHTAPLQKQAIPKGFAFFRGTPEWRD